MRAICASSLASDDLDSVALVVHNREVRLLSEMTRLLRIWEVGKTRHKNLDVVEPRTQLRGDLRECDGLEQIFFALFCAKEANWT